MKNPQGLGKRLRLVVGGGRAEGFPKLMPGDIALNIDGEARPDVQGDIKYAPFASGAFALVYLEKVPFPSFSGANVQAIQECARLLELNGRLVIETGEKAPVEEITDALQRAGFRYVRVTHKGFLRITGRLRRS